ncbi:MAG: diguanylate cyclase [Acidobacteria bacterium]|nr:diguanylate cyclase [Acidobacteriota bacterium]
MNICIPVNSDEGIASPVCAHFGSAPFFMIVDTELGTCRALPNRNQHHAHGMCQPLMAIQGEDLGGIVVGGIGMGALSKLLASGLQVYRAEHPTVEMTMAAFKAGKLRAMTADAACGGHGQGHQHGHAHGRG